MMLRINQFAKLFTTSSHVKTFCTRIFIGDIPNNSRHVTLFRIPRSFFSSKGNDDKSKVCDNANKGKKEDSSIQTHPCPSKSKPASAVAETPQVKLRECKPIDLNPCKPPPEGCPSKIPSIQDCPTPNLMSQIPEPKSSWDSQENNNRKKKLRVLWLGLLITAFTLGAVWYIGFMDYKGDKRSIAKKSVPEKKKKSRCSKRLAIKDPPDVSHIPKQVPYLLIGGGTASFSAFRAIKSADPTAKVLVITNESFFPYMRPPLSKEIWFNEDAAAVKKLMFKQWNGSERSLFYEPDDFYIDCSALMSSPNGGVAVARGWTITHLDAVERLAYLEDGSAIQYEKCLVATGASPRLSAVFQAACADDAINEKIKIFRNIEDFEDALEAFEESSNIAIVGGGFLGSELACAMGRKDKSHRKTIYQIFRESGNMGKILPEYLSYWTTEKVKAEGVEVMPNTEVVGVRTEKKGLELTLNNGKKVYVDNVIVAVGVEPNTDLAEKSDLEVDPELGGFLVNTELQARTDLYIAGDCACFYDPKLGRRRIEHHDHAVVSGRLAGENMTGARKPYYHQSMFWSDLGPDVGYEAIGIVDASLPTVGVFAKATDKDSPKAVVSATDEGIRSNIQEVPKECDKFVSPEQKQELEESRKIASIPNRNAGEDFGKGVIFYLRNDIVVGIVLWNVFNRMSIARQVLKDQKRYDDLNEVAKLFNIHEE